MAGSSRQTFNFVLSRDTGSLGYLWSLSGGRRGKKESEREGLPLRRGCETVGPREAAMIPRALQALENALLTHHRCVSAGVGGRGGVRPAKRVDALPSLGHRFFQLFNTLKGTHWLSRLGGPWRERGAGGAVGWRGLWGGGEVFPLSGTPAPSQLPHPVCAGNTKRHSAPSTWAHAEATSFLFFSTAGDRLERK